MYIYIHIHISHIIYFQDPDLLGFPSTLTSPWQKRLGGTKAGGALPEAPLGVGRMTLRRRKSMSGF